MSLLNIYTKNEIELFEEATGTTLEDKKYADEEKRRFGHEITEYIMSKSSKNGEIGTLMNQYDNILKVLIKK